MNTRVRQAAARAAVLAGTARSYADMLSDPCALAVENLADAIEELALAIGNSAPLATENASPQEPTE